MGWAVDGGADYLIGETFSYAAEALLALEVMKRSGLPAVITLTAHRDAGMRDGMSVTEACQRLEDAGADVVGLNCSRGPRTMLPLLAEILPRVSVKLAALPVPYRTTTAQPSMQSPRDPARPERPSPPGSTPSPAPGTRSPSSPAPPRPWA